ncbi:hypothetical protein [Plebeiibacterium sediminum]|uniref:Uncharacterized protein n=1 Tax=Plebeiibacterium sediminum TaxID=2992112 RepID=A0AAE3M6T0_9BACT|nr:hypothetical protein [Plebeiobacterium sediminum]MCW3787854.1 hypothetical protein [Plebeiobacterium sediminum]
MTSNSQLHTIEFYSAVINHITEMVVGVEKIVGIYNIEDGTNQLFGTCLSLQNNQLVEQELIIDDDIISLQQLQRERIQYKWLNKSQIPFEEKQINSGQLNIFNEYNNLILLVSIPQLNSSKRNLVFVYFKDELDQFGVHHEKSKLSTQNKTIIGHLVSKSVISLSKIYWTQDYKMKRFAQKTQEVIQFQKKSNENKENNQGLENLIIGWATDLIEECSKSDGINYVYQKDAIEKIIQFKGSFNDLKKSLYEAIEYAKMLNSYSDTNQVIIEADYISEVTYVNSEEITYENIILPERLQKTQQLLDKLERYALKISHEGIKLTSTNVGRSMDNPITAAAISDSISKNKDRINTLFKQFPDKWSFIKNNFKPIINITSKENYQSRKWG